MANLLLYLTLTTSLGYSLAYIALRVLKHGSVWEDALVVGISFGLLFWPVAYLLQAASFIGIWQRMGSAANVGTRIDDLMKLAFLLNPVGAIASAASGAAIWWRRGAKWKLALGVALPGFGLNLAYLFSFDG